MCSCIQSYPQGVLFKVFVHSSRLLFPQNPNFQDVNIQLHEVCATRYLKRTVSFELGS